MEELLIFKNWLVAMALWLACTIGACCIGLHIIDDTFRIVDIIPLSLLIGRGISYLWCSVQYHRMLKKVKEINKGGINNDIN